MKTRLQFISELAFSAGLISLAGCGGGDGAPGNSPVGDIKSIDGINFHFYSPKNTWNRGESIPINLSIVNTRSDDVIISMQGDPFQFYIFKHNEFLLQVPFSVFETFGDLRLNRGETWSKALAWDQNIFGFNGEAIAVEPDVYTIVIGFEGGRIVEGYTTVGSLPNLETSLTYDILIQ